MKRLRSIKLLKQRSQVDIWIIILPILLSLFGILMIFESSNVAAFRDFSDKYHFARIQFGWFIFGLSAMLVTSKISYKKYYNWSLPLLLSAIIFQILLFIPGVGVKALGASRWLNFGVINFQPSELAKLAMIFYLSAWFTNKEKGRLIPFLLLLLLMVGLVILQPDLGTAIILAAISTSLYFLSQAPIYHFLFLVPMAITIVIGLAVSSPYRLRRLTSFLNPNSDPLGSSYHIRQILISLGSGGLFGLGLGASRQKYQFLPEATTDSIFAIIGEEFGFIGACLLIVCYIFFLYKLLKVARKAPDRQGYLLSSGMLVLFLCQIVINLGAMVALVPLTGVPLPFISYGGSNLVISFLAVGVVLNINRHLITKD